MFAHFCPSPNRASAVDAPTNGAMSQPKNFQTLHVVALTLAILTTSTSLGIATYAGWQRGGPLVEHMMNVALGGVAVLYVHLLPMGGRMLRVPARICAVAMWCVSVVVVLYGQVSFFVVSHQHAGNQRASTVLVTVVPHGTGLPPGRTLTDIAQNVAKVSGDLASVNARHCAGECPTLKVRRSILAAQLAALNTEAGEAKRREAEEDRRNEQADRNEALRATLRADPVVSPVASWLGTTERGLELMLALACAVVLEGAAIIGWLLVSVASGRAAAATDCGLVKQGRAGGRETIASSRETAAPEREAVAPGRAVTVGESVGSLVTSEDDLLLKKIHEAVVTGQLKPTQEAIRKLLRCRQPKAGSLNRQYIARFGSMHSQGGHIENIIEAPRGGAFLRVSPDMAHVRHEIDVRGPSVAMPAVADA